MNKRQYVMMLLGMFLAKYLVDIVGVEVIKKLVYGAYLACVYNVFGAIFFGFTVLLGINLSQRVGLRLLFLEGQFDFIKDILKPAVFISILYACVLVIFRTLLHLAIIPHFSDGLDKLFLISWYILIYDVMIFLFGLSGCALFIKKVGNNMSMSFVMPLSIFLIALIYNVGMAWMCGVVSLVGIVAIMPTFISDIIVGTLFWKKGFEAAVLCHIIIATILHIISSGGIF
jgi:hypothetical protein